MFQIRTHRWPWPLSITKTSPSKINIQSPIARDHILPNNKVFTLSFAVSPFFARETKTVVVLFLRKSSVERSVIITISHFTFSSFSVKFNEIGIRHQISASIFSQHFSQQTRFIRSLNFRSNNFWKEHAMGDTLLNVFRGVGIFGNNIKTIINPSPQAGKFLSERN